MHIDVFYYILIYLHHKSNRSSLAKFLSTSQKKKHELQAQLKVMMEAFQQALVDDLRRETTL